MEDLVQKQENFKTVIVNDYKIFKKAPKERLAKQSYLSTRLDSLEKEWE